MALMFITSFTVVNETTETLVVSPVGTVGAGDRHLLPLYATHTPACMAPRDRRFQIGPGESRRFLYDWDDINFSELAIESEDSYRMLVVDPKPTENQYHMPYQDVFVIDTLSALPPASAEVREAVENTSATDMWLRTVLGASPLLVLVPLYWIGFGTRRNPGPCRPRRHDA
jgi:hypothetical protein